MKSADGKMIGNLTITPAFSFEDFEGAVERKIFQDVLLPTPLGKAPTIGARLVYRAKDILPEVTAVAEYLFRVSKGGLKEVTLWGGYAFFDGAQEFFQIERPYLADAHWKQAFRLIEHTSPVEVNDDGHFSKLIRIENTVELRHRRGSHVMPLADFLRETTEAMSEWVELRSAVAKAVRARFEREPEDLLSQLERGLPKGR